MYTNSTLSIEATFVTITLQSSKQEDLNDTISIGRIQNMDRGPWTTRWTWSMDHPMDPVHGPSPWATPNFQKEIATVSVKISPEVRV